MPPSETGRSRPNSKPPTKIASGGAGDAVLLPVALAAVAALAGLEGVRLASGIVAAPAAHHGSLGAGRTACGAHSFTLPASPLRAKHEKLALRRTPPKAALHTGY